MTFPTDLVDSVNNLELLLTLFELLMIIVFEDDDDRRELDLELVVVVVIVIFGGNDNGTSVADDAGDGGVLDTWIELEGGLDGGRDGGLDGGLDEVPLAEEEFVAVLTTLICAI